MIDKETLFSKLLTLEALLREAEGCFSAYSDKEHALRMLRRALDMLYDIIYSIH